MDAVVMEWGGKERPFRLSFGGVLDLEESCGREGIGLIWTRVSSGAFRASDVFNVIKFGLIGGGESIIDAKLLMDRHFDTRPYSENCYVAGEILMALMTGIEKTDGGEDGDPSAPFKVSDVMQACHVFNMSPDDLRAMRFADYLNMVKGYNAASPDRDVAPPTEEEFLELLKWDAERTEAAHV